MEAVRMDEVRKRPKSTLTSETDGAIMLNGRGIHIYPANHRQQIIDAPIGSIFKK